MELPTKTPNGSGEYEALHEVAGRFQKIVDDERTRQRNVLREMHPGATIVEIDRMIGGDLAQIKPELLLGPDLRLLGRFQNGDPISVEDIESIERYAEQYSVSVSEHVRESRRHFFGYLRNAIFQQQAREEIRRRAEERKNSDHKS